MEEVIIFILFFLLVYGMYYLFVISRKKKLKQYYQSTEVRYLEMRYHIDLKDVPIQKLARTLAFANAVIISLTAWIASLLPNLILQLVVGFILLILFILIGYHFVGTYYQKKLGTKK